MSTFCVDIFDTMSDPLAQDPCFIPPVYNFTINKGNSDSIKFLLSRNGSKFDLTGCCVRGKILSDISNILLNMNSANLILSIDVDNSCVIMNLTESFTSSVKKSYATYYIELLRPTADAYKIVEGSINFKSRGIL